MEFSQRAQAPTTRSALSSRRESREIYLKICDKPILSKIDDARLRELCDALNISPRAGYLD
jgi:hypothetical protein